MSSLIIDGVDHSKFDLEWAERGGIVLFNERAVCHFIRMTTHYTAQLYSLSGTRGVMRHGVIFMRMATPTECQAAGIKYIEPPARWLPIEYAPMDGTSVLSHPPTSTLVSEFKYTRPTGYDIETHANYGCGYSWCKRFNSYYDGKDHIGHDPMPYEITEFYPFPFPSPKDN